MLQLRATFATAVGEQLFYLRCSGTLLLPLQHCALQLYKSHETNLM